MNPIAPARIGSGVPLFIIGGCLLAFGIFGVLAGAGGSEGAAAMGGGALGIGSAIVAIAFWVNLFSKVEARLIDIQTALARVAETSTATVSNVAPPQEPAGTWKFSQQPPKSPD